MSHIVKNSWSGVARQLCAAGIYTLVYITVLAMLVRLDTTEDGFPDGLLPVSDGYAAAAECLPELFDASTAESYALSTLSPLVTVWLSAVVWVDPDYIQSLTNPSTPSALVPPGFQHHISVAAIDVSSSEVRPGALTSSRGPRPIMKLGARFTYQLLSWQLIGIPHLYQKNGLRRDDSAAFMDVFWSYGNAPLVARQSSPGRNQKLVHVGNAFNRKSFS
ncbi:hypothetical protein F4774DRAFT_424767 [Daldinia eschscholtzii]|nr:hypothetical protein F4774DRAFT_424767 [Daldinia eschscholtzii]